MLATLPRLGSMVRLPSPAPSFLKESTGLRRSVGLFAPPPRSANPGKHGGSSRKRKVAVFGLVLASMPARSQGFSRARQTLGQRRASAKTEVSCVLFPRCPSRDGDGCHHSTPSGRDQITDRGSGNGPAQTRAPGRQVNQEGSKPPRIGIASSATRPHISAKR